MKAWDYDAVTYNGEIYCTECLPDGIGVNNEEVSPIFASSEWSFPGATCGDCGYTHDYMSLIDMPEPEEEDDPDYNLA
jgi:hypothetical protein